MPSGSPDDAEIGRVVGEVTISYSVRELLSRIEERQIRTDEKITKLATAEEVADLRRDVDRHEARWNRVLGAAIAVAAMTGGAAGWVTALIGGQ
jgi:tellurite resistance protein